MSMIKVKHWAAVVLTYPLALVVCVVLVPVFAGIAAYGFVDDLCKGGV